MRLWTWAMLLRRFGNQRAQHVHSHPTPAPGVLPLPAGERKESMRPKRAIVLSGALSAAVWTSTSAHAIGPDQGGDQDGEEAAAVIVTAEQNRSEVHVPAGTPVIIQLESNPSTGFDWHVESTDRTLGYPVDTRFLVDPFAPPGTPGLRQFEWRTAGPLDMTGPHPVRLAYYRIWDPEQVADTFEVTIIIDAPDQDAPDQDTPQQDAPDQDTPDQDAPDQDTPQQDAPDQDTPQQDAPQQEAPDQDVPQQDAPDQDVADEDVPDQETPQQDTPDQSGDSESTP
jgi:predicted secreted protein